VVEVEGTAGSLQIFQQRLTAEKPPHAWLQQIDVATVDCQGDATFEIRPSDRTATKTALILPDLATCSACLAELWDPQNRRYRYPFINCTHCGPRFSIVRSLPYDRPHTTMAGFPLCPDCQREYGDPGDRRFHAQPNACPTCGPHLELWDPQGQVLATRDQALQQAAAAVLRGQVLALKGLGGFHLIVDATNEAAVQTLRQRKHRPTKPLAVMFPSLDSLNVHCQVSPEAATLLQSAAAPIVLLPSGPHPLAPYPQCWGKGDQKPPLQVLLPSPKLGRGAGGEGQQPCDDPELSPAIAPNLTPDNPYLGVMLPYTPLHHLLLAAIDRPVVATSGNRSGEPICIDEQEALERLGEIADRFLIHNRPIARPVDDSIVQLVRGQPVPLRRARGYAPMPIQHFSPQAISGAASLPAPSSTEALGRETARVEIPPTPLNKGGNPNQIVKSPLNKRAAIAGDLPLSLAQQGAQRSSPTILAVGGHLKNTVALHHRGHTLISPHLGDLDTVQGRDRFQEMIRHLCGLYDLKPDQVDAIACDAHPDYVSSQFAQTLAADGPQLIAVQHHYAHVLACMADNQWQPPVLGVAWDGAGYGLDGTIWGGEVLWIPAEGAPGFERVAHVKPFPLPGGDRAAREPRRSAMGLRYGCGGSGAWADPPLAIRQAFSPQEFQLIQQMLMRGVNTPRTSSVGRLFDGVAALVGLCQRASFEGEAAMALEAAIAGLETDAIYPYRILVQPDQPLQFDPAPMLRMIETDLENKAIATIAAQFHNTLIAGLVKIIHHLRERYPEIQKIVLTGGCFQNRYLLERALQQLERQGFLVGYHQQVPSNDGGIALGQIWAGLNCLDPP
jgi:hydrogenase maturation protein HypF